MFGFSRRRMKLGRLKVQLTDSTQGTKSPIRHTKRLSHSNIENVISASYQTGDTNCQYSSSSLDLCNSTSGSSQKWMSLSTAGEKPPSRFSHAATVVGCKMVVVGGESGRGLLEDVQVLNFDKLSWNAATPKLYLSPTSLPLKIPACKGHSLNAWGKRALMIGGKTDPSSDKISVWSFDTETECWAHVEAKGDIPVARSGHTAIRAGTVLILFGGEDAKGRKLNDLHMFDLKSLTWLPLHCTGTEPSPRSNHVAALYDDRILYIFGGASKSRVLNDLYSLDFETMVWSRIKVWGFQPTPRAGCCGVLCGSKWYIAGGGSRKKRNAETLVFDVLKVEWSVAVPSSPSSVTANKGFSLVLMQHKERVFLVTFGGIRKEASNQVEILTLVKSELSMGQQPLPNKDSLPLKTCANATGFPSHLNNGTSQCPIDPFARHNMASVTENRSSGRKSLPQFSIDANPANGNVSLRKQFHQEEEYNSILKMQKPLEGEKYSDADDCSLRTSQRNKSLDAGVQVDVADTLGNAEQTETMLDSENSKGHLKQAIGNGLSEGGDLILPETDVKSIGITTTSIYQTCEAKMAVLLQKNGVLEVQLAAALANREAAEKNLASAIKSRQDMERKLTGAMKEVELLKEKLTAAEIAQEEANSLTNIVHSDNVRLEHDVAFLKAVLDDTQKELHSTRGVLAGERARAFQLQVEVFHLKQRLQSVDNRVPTPRKPFHA